MTPTRPPLVLADVTGFTWSRDASQLLVSAQDTDGSCGLWQLDASTGTSRRLREGVARAALSPDGGKIGFVDEGGRQIWLMDASGDHARVLLAGAEGDSFREIAWSPDGRRLLLGKVHFGAANLEIALLAVDEAGAVTTILKSDPALRSTAVTATGRLIYAVADHKDTILWECETVDWIKGATSRRREIARIAGSEVFGLSVSSDGSRLALLKGPYQADVYLGALEGPGLLHDRPVKLTRDDRNDFITTWTNDGGAVFFHSDRHGHWEIYRQRVDALVPDLVVTGPDDYRAARLAPDGQSLYYIERPRSTKIWQWLSPVRLMRVSLSNGAMQLVREARANLSLRCARAPAMTCVVAERTWSSELSLQLLDTRNGTKVSLPSLTLDTAFDQVNWDLSPDGTRIAAVLADSPAGARIRTRLVEHGPTQDITIRAASAFRSIDWSTDGRGWYVSSASAEGSRILYVDEQGRSRLVEQQPRSFGTWAIPSPDGRRLALVEWSAAQNVWMMER